MKRKLIGIVDYGVGNHTSVIRAFQGLGNSCQITSEKEVLAAADIIVLPGVGAFPAAMECLIQRGLVDCLKKFAKDKKPILGVCLGMQLLASKSLEYSDTDGLDLIPGVVRPLGGHDPHVGWNSIKAVKKNTLISDGDGKFFYFNHSFVIDTPAPYRIAESQFNKQCFTVAVQRGNVVGLQFHPEKSQGAGWQLLRSLLMSMCYD